MSVTLLHVRVVGRLSNREQVVLDDQRRARPAVRREWIEHCG
jgi:hypothetical protein